ncbi:MAG: hypothetical protein E7399_04465 [Ruminococcaceae bacterium]|nr:hypothetical protein [Oscillospiraceae bacterium]
MEEQKNMGNISMEQPAELDQSEQLNETKEPTFLEKSEQDNNKFLKKLIKSKYIIAISAVLIAVIIILSGILRNPYNQIMNAIGEENIEEAQEIYNNAGEKKKEKIDEKIEETCEEKLEKYNQEKLSYETVHKLISAFCNVSSAASEYSFDLSELKASKTAFSNAQEMKEKKEWDNAIEEYKKVIETDINYDIAITEIENCQKNLSLDHFKKAEKYKKEKNWASAIDEYSQVTDHTPTEYEAAQKELPKCADRTKQKILYLSRLTN